LFTFSTTSKSEHFASSVGSKYSVLPPINPPKTTDSGSIISGSNTFQRISPESAETDHVESESREVLGDVEACLVNNEQERETKSQSSDSLMVVSGPSSKGTQEKQEDKRQLEKLNNKLEHCFKKLMREFGASNIYDKLGPYETKQANFSKQLNELLQNFTKVLLEKLLTTSQEEFIKNHFVKGLYDRIKLNEQLIDAKIDNLVAIKQGEKTSMDTNDNLIEVKKQEMVELESLRNTEIQNIIKQRENRERAKLQAYEIEFANETKELETLENDLRKKSDENRKIAAKSRYEIEDFKDDIMKAVRDYDNLMIERQDRQDMLENKLEKLEAMNAEEDEAMKPIIEEFQDKIQRRNDMINKEFFRMTQFGNMIGREWRGLMISKAEITDIGMSKKKKKGKKGGKKGKKGGKKGKKGGKKGGGVKKGGTVARKSPGLGMKKGKRTTGAKKTTFPRKTGGTKPRRPIIGKGKKGKKSGKGKKKAKAKGGYLDIIPETDDAEAYLEYSREQKSEL